MVSEGVLERGRERLSVRWWTASVTVRELSAPGIFNEGCAATAVEDWVRPALCEEALRLGRIMAELAPKGSEVHCVVALMEILTSDEATLRTASRPASSVRLMPNLAPRFALHESGRGPSSSTARSSGRGDVRWAP